MEEGVYKSRDWRISLSHNMISLLWNHKPYTMKGGGIIAIQEPFRGKWQEDSVWREYGAGTQKAMPFMETVEGA